MTVLVFDCRIENLLLLIQRLGNLADMSSYIIYDNCIGFDTNMYDEGIGELFFNVYFDKEKGLYVVYILDVNWDFKSNHLYNYTGAVWIKAV